MPELPEVEATKLHLAQHVKTAVIQQVIIRCKQLRWPIPKHLPQTLKNQRLQHIDRRGKYLLLYFETGILLMHLGMSGYIRLLPLNTPFKKHEHVDLIFNHLILRFCDPRRFGAILWTIQSPYDHALLKDLGVEPLSQSFNGHYLHQASQTRGIPIKQLLMDHKVVTGIGNIYANEIAYKARIHPLRPAHTLHLTECQSLATASKQVLKKAIQAGGTTIKDFQINDTMGYFQQQLQVYGRQGLPCPRCATLLDHKRLGGRITIFCPQCQH